MKNSAPHRNSLIVAAALAFAGPFLVAQPAHAVLLEQNWQAGQSQAYSLALNGKLNLQLPANAPVLIAGMPLDIMLTGQSNSELVTQSVEKNGAGNILINIPLLSLQGQSMGQTGVFTMRDGKSSFTLNGKAMQFGPPTADAFPVWNWRISRLGHIEAITPVPKTAPVAPAPKSAPGAAFNEAGKRTALMQAVILSTLPTLWPGHNVEVGDSWQAKLPWPVQGDEKAAPLGSFTLTLKDSTVVNGDTIWRVTIQGGINLDANQIAIANEGLKKLPQANGALTEVKQDITGDLWFDQQKGQITRGKFAITSHVQGANDEDGDDNPHVDFTGTLNIALQK